MAKWACQAQPPLSSQIPGWPRTEHAPDWGLSEALDCPVGQKAQEVLNTLLRFLGLLGRLAVWLHRQTFCLWETPRGINAFQLGQTTFQFVA